MNRHAVGHAFSLSAGRHGTPPAHGGTGRARVPPGLQLRRCHRVVVLPSAKSPTPQGLEILMPRRRSQVAVCSAQLPYRTYGWCVSARICILTYIHAVFASAISVRICHLPFTIYISYYSRCYCHCSGSALPPMYSGIKAQASCDRRHSEDPGGAPDVLAPSTVHARPGGRLRYVFLHIALYAGADSSASRNASVNSGTRARALVIEVQVLACSRLEPTSGFRAAARWAPAVSSVEVAPDELVPLLVSISDGGPWRFASARARRTVHHPGSAPAPPSSTCPPPREPVDTPPDLCSSAPTNACVCLPVSGAPRRRRWSGGADVSFCWNTLTSVGVRSL